MIINNIVISAKVASTPESKEFGAHTLSKVNVEVAQLKKEKGEWVHQHYAIEAKGWNKTAEKIQKLVVGQRVVLIGKLAADVFEYQGQPRQKLFLDVFSLENMDPGPRASTQSRQTETATEEPVTEDDIPF